MKAGFSNIYNLPIEGFKIIFGLLNIKEKVSLFTTSKSLYQQIPKIEVNSLAAAEAPLLSVVELKSGQSCLSLSVQWLIFTHIFKFKPFEGTLGMTINSKMKSREGEVDQLLDIMGEKDPILEAFTQMEILSLRWKENLEQVCNHMPKLSAFAIVPIDCSIDGAVCSRYRELFKTKNILFGCNMELLDFTKEEYPGFISAFMNSTFSFIHPTRIFVKVEKSQSPPVFGFVPRNVP